MKLKFFITNLILILLIINISKADTSYPSRPQQPQIPYTETGAYIIEGLESEQPFTAITSSPDYDITLTIGTQIAGTSTGLYNVCLGFQCVIPRLFAIEGWAQVYDSELYPGYAEAGGKVYISGRSLVMENYGLLKGKKYGVASSRIDKKAGTFYTATVKVFCNYMSKGNLTLEVFNNAGTRIYSNTKSSSPISAWQTLQVQAPKDISGTQNILLHLEQPGKCLFKEPQLSKGIIGFEFYDTTNKPMTECCPVDYCWNGERCIENQANEPWEAPVINSLDGSYGYRCVNGNWKVSQKKISWEGDETEFGYCPENADCLVNPTRDTQKLGFYKSITTFLQDTTSYYSEDITENSPSIQCIKNKESLADHYCENGKWTTRTKQLALQLLSLAGISSGSDYTLLCDNYKNALVNFEEMVNSIPVEDYITGTLRTLQGTSCFTENYKMPCLNNFCILRFNDKVVLGASLNKPINEIPLAFIETLKNKDGNPLEADCSSAGSQDRFYQCDSNKILYYNPVKKMFVYSRPGIDFIEQSPLDLITIFFENIKRFVLDLWQPKFGFLNKPYDFIEKADFNEIYLSRNDNIRTIKGIKEKDYYSFEFRGFSPETNVSDAVLAKETLDMDVRFGCGRHYVITQEPDAIGYFVDLGAKLRVQPQTSQPIACNSCQQIVSQLGAKWFDQSRETCTGESFSYLDGECCLGKVALKKCLNFGGEICNGRCDRGFTTRAEMVAALVRANQLSLPSSCSPSFPDVASDYWACREIEAAKNAGWIVGFPDGTFKPERLVSRAEAARFLVKAFGYDTSISPECGSETFPDVPCTHTVYREIEAIVREGITQGYLDGKYRPDTILSRAHLAIFAARAANICEQDTGHDCNEFYDCVTHPLSPYPDVDCWYFAYPWIVAVTERSIMVGYEDGGYGPGNIDSEETAGNNDLFCCLGTCAPRSCSDLGAGTVTVCTGTSICDGIEISTIEGRCCIGSCQ